MYWKLFAENSIELFKILTLLIKKIKRALGIFRILKFLMAL